MSWFYNLKVGKKLILSFIITSAITAFIGFEAISNMGNINDMLKSLYENETMGISYLKEANINVSDFGRAENQFLSSSNREEREKYSADMQEFEKKLKSNIEKARPLVSSEKEKELINQFDDEWVTYKKIVDKVVSMAEAEGFIEQRKSIQLSKTEGHQQSKKINAIIGEIASIKELNGKDAFNKSEALYSQSKTFMLTIIFVALGLGIGDRVAMLENTWYSVISPESCSSILWRSWDHKEEAAEALRLTASDIKVNFSMRPLGYGYSSDSER